MNIATTAKLSGLPAKTNRYYEYVGIIVPMARTASGYRRYTETDAQALRFIHRARNPGFSVKDESKLLNLWREKGRMNADVKALANESIRRIEKKLAMLEASRGAPSNLIGQCIGDFPPACPILDELAESWQRPFGDPDQAAGNKL